MVVMMLAERFNSSPSKLTRGMFNLLATATKYESAPFKAKSIAISVASLINVWSIGTRVSILSV